jgi:Tfp pilus assembly protein PilO
MWIIGAVLALGVVAGMGWFLGIQPQLTAAAMADDERATVAAANLTSEATLAKLKSDYSNLSTLKEDLTSLSQSVPNGSEIPAFVNELNALVVTHGVTFVNMSVADAQPYTPAVPPAPATSSSTATPTPTPTASATPAPVAPTAGVPPVANALITPTNFASIPVALTISGGYGNVLDFVKGLQTGSRLFMITSLSTAASTQGAPGTVDGTISGLIYVLIPPGTTLAKATG